jgi:hypothetical protein
MTCITDADIVRLADRDKLAIEQVVPASVVRTYSSLIGLPLPADAHISSMLTIRGAVNIYAAVIDTNGCVVQSVFVPREIHEKAMGNPL